MLTINIMSNENDLPINELIKYARLVLNVGVNFQKGQCLRISSEPVHRQFIIILSTEAYKMGAKYVYVQYADQELVKSRVENCQVEEHLEFVPDFYSSLSAELVKDNSWAHISLSGSENPDVFKEIDVKKLNLCNLAFRKVFMPVMNNLIAHKNSWCVCAVPTDKWAAKVINDGSKINLWKNMAKILRLDSEETVEQWRNHCSKLKNRADYLTKKQFKYLHFTGPGTDLKVHLINDCGWKGGGAITSDGREFVPNLPTEEVFTSPNKFLTEGRALITRPVSVFGYHVRDAWFEFKSGKVAEFGASDGREFLQKFLETDSGSSFLGEVALVDSSSLIYQSGLVFQNILFDENASCHIALGAAYPLNLSKKSLSDLEKEEIGLNTSQLHTDFMIGSDELSVKAFTDTGVEECLVEKGKFISI